MEILGPSGARKFEAPNKTGAEGGSVFGPEPNVNNDPLNDYINRQIGRVEVVDVEQASHPKTTQEYYYGLRSIEAFLEDGNIPKEANDRWLPTRIHSAMYGKAKELGTPIRELVSRGWIVADEKLGGYKPNPDRPEYSSYAISFKPVILNSERTDKRGYRHKTETVEYKYNFGEATINRDPRKELACALEKGITEFQARSIMGEHISIRTSLRFRDSLEDLVSIMHGGGVSYFKGAHLSALFNMPGVEELAGGIELRPDQVALVSVKEGEPEFDKEQKLLKKEDLIKQEFEVKHELGDQVEEAMFLNLIMLNSSNKSRMERFLKRPGAIRLIDGLANKIPDSEVGGVEGLNEDEKKKKKVGFWITKYIGKVDDWVGDKDRILENDGKSRIKATWRTETELGKRGLLTKWGNIPAWGGNPSEFGANKELDFIEGAIGKAVGSKEASWLATTMMRVIGAYASEGYAVLPPAEDGKLKGKFLLPLGEGRYLSGDDTGKFYANLFNLKEGLKGRASGLKDMIGKIPDMAMNLFDWAGVEVEGPEYPHNWDGTLQRRSIWDAWLGTAEQPLMDLLTGNMVEVKRSVQNGTEKWVEVVREVNDKGQTIEKTQDLDEDTTDRINRKMLKVGKALGVDGKDLKDEAGLEKLFLIVPEEKGQRLGDLKFDTLEREFHGTFTIMQWLMGNGEGPTGVFSDAMKTDFRYEDFALQELKKKIKYIGIVMNPVILTKGSQHLYKDAGTSSGIIQINFFKNLMAARIRSSSFAQNILGGVIKFFDPEKKAHVDVSQAKLIEKFIDEAVNDNPKSVVELVKNYVDNNYNLRRSGTTNEADTFLEKSKGMFSSITGRVTGKNRF